MNNYFTESFLVELRTFRYNVHTEEERKFKFISLYFHFLLFIKKTNTLILIVFMNSFSGIVKRKKVLMKSFLNSSVIITNFISHFIPSWKIFCCSFLSLKFPKTMDCRKSTFETFKKFLPTKF